MLRDQVDVLDVAVGDRDRPILVDGLDRPGAFVVERIEIFGAGGVLFAFGQGLDLEGAPRQAVVVLVAQQPQQHARDALEFLDDADDLGLDRRTQLRIGIVGIRQPDAVQGEAVAGHRMVQHREDAVRLVDVADPAGRDARVVADRVDAHVQQQGHLAGQGRFDDRVGLVPETICIVLADRHVSPVHAQDHEIASVDLEFLAVTVGDDPDLVVLRERRRAQAADQEREDREDPESFHLPAGLQYLVFRVHGILLAVLIKP